jgi:uncharacterized membrane protein
VATLTVWKFDTPDGADQVSGTLEGLARQGLIRINDAATVSWEAGDKKPRTRQMGGLAGVGALGGAFWGLLFGLIFFIPLIGAAVGAAAGAFAASLADVGIDDGFIKRVREEITPGTSALFLLSSDAALDRVRAAFATQSPKLMYTDLDDEQERALREVFAD